VAIQLKSAVNAFAGGMAVALLRAVRLTDPDRISDFAGAVLRRIGPWLPEHRTGRANLAAAFPEKSAGEIEDILRRVWTNVGRLGAEFAHLDRLWDYDPERPGTGRIEFSPESYARVVQLREDGRPALLFSAHLANWEMPALAASAFGVETAILYRPPNIADVAQAVQAIRAINMGNLIATDATAPLKMAAALECGLHAVMMVDQHFSRGVEVTFFGRPCRTNPLIARLARHFDCPIHGARAIRLPGNRFRLEVSEPIIPARDASGQVDVVPTMQIITAVVEGWVREHPDQWLWLHRRWR
jgi:KDO2-lipid IV(A) lauroyltransferase